MRKQLILAVAGPLKGLIYVVFLPLIGTLTILVIGIHKLAMALKMSSKPPSAPQDKKNPVLEYPHEGKPMPERN